MRWISEGERKTYLPKTSTVEADDEYTPHNLATSWLQTVRNTEYLMLPCKTLQGVVSADC